MASPHDRSRLEACFENHYPEIERHLRRRCPSPEDAEDAATEVFTIAWRRVRRMPEEPESRLWLYGIARLVLANHDNINDTALDILSDVVANAVGTFAQAADRSSS